MKHIVQKLQEAEFFLNGMKHYSDEVMSRVRFGDSVFTPHHYPLVRAFQYHLSGMLSAWQCVAYYMAAKCRRNAEAKKWYDSLKNRKLLAAFKHLRDSDIHDETISPAVQHTIRMGPQGSQERGFTVASGSLHGLERFKNHSNLADMLCERPILSLAEDALNELRTVVEEGRAKGYLTP